MKLLIILAFLTCAYCFTNLTFTQWRIKYRITFASSKERKIREKLFLETKNEIIAHNLKPHNTFEKDLNPYSDLTSDEFISSRCGTKLPERLRNSTESRVQLLTEDSFRAFNHFGNYTTTNAPNSTDFTGLMQPVQNQLGCGACWAFTAMGQIESLLKIGDSSYSTVLSSQFLLDCNTAQEGCIGGWPTDALLWLRSSLGGNNKAPASILYPYRAAVKTCRKTLSTISLGIKQVRESYLGGDEGAMKAQIANSGPIIVAIHASNDFQSYSNGVFYDSTCPSGNDCILFNHAVIVVGYGTDLTLGDYWMVKNSWGTNWGENGYVRMARNRGNNCNIACYAMLAQ